MMRFAPLIVCLFAILANAQQTPDDPTLGLSIASVQDMRAALTESKIPIPAAGSGVMIAQVVPNSPAASKGLRAMDVLVIKKNGKTIATIADFAAWAKTWKVGVPVKVAILRVFPSPSGAPAWKRDDVELVPVTRHKLEDDSLRASYIKVDGAWREVPKEILNYVENPKTEFRSFEVGKIGTSVFCRVRQVIGKDDAIFTVNPFTGFPADIRIIHRSTDGLVDGRIMKLDDPIAIIGTWQYETAIGGSRTVFLAIPQDALKAGLSDSELAELKERLKKNG